jgi:hypothetical protein
MTDLQQKAREALAIRLAGLLARNWSGLTSREQEELCKYGDRIRSLTWRNLGVESDEKVIVFQHPEQEVYLAHDYDEGWRRTLPEKP